MLKKITVKNYRRFEDVTIDLGNIVLIAGKNGTGKSSFVELLYKLRLFIVSDGPDNHVESLLSTLDLPRWKAYKDDQVQTAFSIEWEYSEGVFKWDLLAQYTKLESKYRVIYERLTHNSEGLYISTYEHNIARTFSDNKNSFEEFPVDWIHSNLRLASRINSKIRFFLEEIGTKIWSTCITPETMIDGAGYFDFYGNNFSKLFYRTSSMNIEVMGTIAQSYKDFLPNCTHTAFSPQDGTLVIIERGGANKEFSLRFSELSAGQKKLCIYYTILKIALPGSTLIFDEFENHLSPVELVPLYQRMQEEQEAKDLQVVIVSHHHKTLNWYNDVALVFTLVGEPASIKIVEKDENATVIEMMARG